MKRSLTTVRLLVGLAFLAVVVTTAPAMATPGYFISAGDSQAKGVVDTPQGPKFTPGYNSAVRRSLGSGTKLINLGCSGATTTEFIKGGKCQGHTPLYAGKSTQFRALKALVKNQGKRVKVVTLNVGANNIIPCIDYLAAAINYGCLAAAFELIKKDMTRVTQQVKSVAHSGTKLVCMGYYNPLVVLPNQQVAEESRVFANQLNLNVRGICWRHGWRFADIPSTFGASLGLAGERGRICELTAACDFPPGVHPNALGYKRMAGQLKAALRG